MKPEKLRDIPGTGVVIMKGREAKPNESRLLTLAETAYLKMEYIKETGETRHDIAKYVEAVKKSQDAKTASIKDAEFKVEMQRVIDDLTASFQSKAEQELREKIEKLYVNLPRFDIESGISAIEKALPELAKEAGYKLPEEIVKMFEGFEETIKLLREQLAHARDGWAESRGEK